MDFLLSDGAVTTPMEVRSGNAASHASIDWFLDHFRVRNEKGIILTKGDFREDARWINLPLAMAMFL